MKVYPCIRFVTLSLIGVVASSKLPIRLFLVAVPLRLISLLSLSIAIVTTRFSIPKLAFFAPFLFVCWGALGEVSFNADIRPLLSDRCFKCHGPDGSEESENGEGGLRLDTEVRAMADLIAVKYAEGSMLRAANGLPAKSPPKASRFAIVPGRPESSSLVERIMSLDEDEVMPPLDSHLSLSDSEKDLLKRWIAEGAQWDGHWAFQTPKSPSLPTVENTSWPITKVDSFVLARLEAKGIEPAIKVTRSAWLRRVTQHLTGLPPTLAEIEAFVVDGSPLAEERVVDRLLGSVDYAERMTAIWLDNARYADSNGFQFDNSRSMWPWRDWVIEAFRENMPYDQFITEQLAGDLLEDSSQQQMIATGFNRNHPHSIEGGIIDEEYRVMYANDKTTTAGTLFLGLTMECTRCHDHKYDPLTMKDYYSLFAFFNTSSEMGAPGEKGFKHKAKGAPPFIEYEPKESNNPEAEKIQVMVMEAVSRQSYILEQGLFDQPGKPVEARTPEILPPFDAYSQDRLGLAQWLTSRDNPLFARVAVNRLWQQFFGIGLVDTPDNFGVQGAQPSHPSLLDWLAVEFRQNDWDLHHLIRSIVLSATYRQSSNFRPNLEDPENRLLARGPTFRLPAEMIRDQALLIGGLLERQVGGPSVMPYQPEGVWEDLNAPESHAEIYEQETGPGLYRKSMYTYWRRGVLHPAMAVFDAPNRDVCSVERESTNTPLQALVTLHGPTYIEASRRLAEVGVGEAAPIDHVFRVLLSRPPEDRERLLLEDLHASRLDRYVKNSDAASQLLGVGDSSADTTLDVAQVAALADVCHALLNLSETITRK